MAEKLTKDKVKKNKEKEVFNKLRKESFEEVLTDPKKTLKGLRFWPDIGIFNRIDKEESFKIGYNKFYNEKIPKSDDEVDSKDDPTTEPWKRYLNFAIGSLFLTLTALFVSIFAFSFAIAPALISTFAVYGSLLALAGVDCAYEVKIINKSIEKGMDKAEKDYEKVAKEVENAANVFEEIEGQLPKKIEESEKRVGQKIGDNFSALDHSNKMRDEQIKALSSKLAGLPDKQLDQAGVQGQAKEKEL